MFEMNIVATMIKHDQSTYIRHLVKAAAERCLWCHQGAQFLFGSMIFLSSYHKDSSLTLVHQAGRFIQFVAMNKGYNLLSSVYQSRISELVKWLLPVLREGMFVVDLPLRIRAISNVKIDYSINRLPRSNKSNILFLLLEFMKWLFLAPIIWCAVLGLGATLLFWRDALYDMPSRRQIHSKHHLRTPTIHWSNYNPSHSHIQHHEECINDTHPLGLLKRLM